MRTIKHSLLFVVLAIFTLASVPVVSRGVNSGGGSATAQVQSATGWQIAGPIGGDVRSMVIDPKDAARIFIGTIDGQIYTSTDGGQAWSRMSGFNRPGLLVDQIIIDPRDSATMFVAAHRHKEPGGFFKTTDGGQTWREPEGFKGEAVHSLVQAPANPDIMVAGTIRGVFRSTDAGETWEQLPTAAYSDLTTVESLAVDPRNSDTIYAGTWHLPWKSTDGGRTWKSIKTGMIDDSDVFAIEIDQRNPDHIIASACSGIYESRNAGANWRKVQGIPSSSRRTRAILQHPSKPEVIFAGTTEGIWRSVNGGDAWSIMEPAVPNPRQLEINTVAVHPQNPDTVYLGTNNYGVMISRDGGKTFTGSNGGFSGRRAYSILQDREQPNRIYATTINTATGGGFFFITEDGGATWRPSMNSLPGKTIINSILQDARDSNTLYLGTSEGVYQSFDRGASWAVAGAPVMPEPKPKTKGKRASSRSKARTTAQSSASASTATAATTTAAAVKPVPPAAKPVELDSVKRAQEALRTAGYKIKVIDGLAGTQTITAVRAFQTKTGIPVSGKLDVATLNALGLVEDAQTIENNPAILTMTVRQLAHSFDERDGRPGIFAATDTGLFRSYDLSKGWEKLPYGKEFDARTLCISVGKENPQTIWIGTAKSGVMKTGDGGQTWKQIPTSIIPSVAPVNVIEQDPSRPGYVYVGTTHTFYLSRDAGEKWMRRGGDLPIGSYTSILINPQNPDEIFVGSADEGNVKERAVNAGGIFRSTDAGMMWTRVDPELPSRRIWVLAFDERDPNKMFVGTHSAGVYIAQRSAANAASAVTTPPQSGQEQPTQKQQEK